jgi:hypothetical protein
MVSTKQEAPNSSKVIEILAQTIGNPIEMKKSDFMIGLVCDQNGNVQENIKKMVVGGNYYFLAYNEITSDVNKGVPDYKELPKYIVPFELTISKDKNFETAFTWLRAGVNAFATIMGEGIYAQDHSEAQIKGSLKYSNAVLNNPKMYLGSYTKDNELAFVMTVSDK